VKIDPQSFANEWLAAWNSRDLVRILGYFTDDIVFRSPHAVELAGEPSGEVRGKDALRAYWRGPTSSAGQAPAQATYLSPRDQGLTTVGNRGEGRQIR
jgi:ketosteroid isomerase-like protein